MAQTVIPYLLYEDAAAMLDWLERAFGFTEKLRFSGDDGTDTHAEMTIGDASVFLGDPGDDYRSAKHGGGWPTQIQVYVDDVDAHYERAKEAGADPAGAERPALWRQALRRLRPRGPPLDVLDPGA
jgi:uncharacterized glyoxalase superfamily protein PhnB